MKAGIGFLIFAMALTPLTDGLSKSLTLGQTAFFVVFARYFSAGLVALVVAGILRCPIHIPHNDRLGQVWRTALMMGAMVAMITALSMVDFAKAVGGFLIAPVIATLISVVLFRERLDGFRIVGAVVSFVGAYVIVRPEGSLEIGTMLALFGGTLLGAYLAATRRACTRADAFSSLIIQCFLGAFLVAPLAFWQGMPVLVLPDVTLIFALGAASAACHFLTIAAYNRADASVLAPFFYFNILFAIPVGYFWFSEVPTMMTLIGLGGITLGGVITMLSERAYHPVLKHFYGAPRKFT